MNEEARQIPVPNPDSDPMLEKKVEGESGYPSDSDIVNVLVGYKGEAEISRESGTFARDSVWKENIDLYWSNFDFSKKAEWQSREVMPEPQQFVDRWAASMREAFTGDWFVVTVPGDQADDLSPIIKKAMRVWLDRCGRTQNGHPVEFSAVFEELMKMGAITACCASVTWKKHGERSYVAIDAVDPRKVWLDATGRNLYRIRQTTIEKHELMRLASLKDSSGEGIYKKEIIEQLQHHISEEEKELAEKMAGHDKEVSSTRVPIKLDEYLCDIVGTDGEVVGYNQLCVVANDRFLIRGPEDNPFWHKLDWIVYCPSVVVPLSVYGRSYMENWSGVAKIFNEMTNLILDSAKTSTINAFAVNTSLLDNPDDMADGIYPNKIFHLQEGVDARQFLQEIELGRLPAESINIWQALRNILREGGAFSELSLGQLSKGEKTAREIAEVSQGSTQMAKSIARTIETRFVEPILDLVWKTGVQHLGDAEKEPEMVKALGVDGFNMLKKRAKELASAGITFRVGAISGIIERNQQLKNLISMIQVISQSEILSKQLFAKISPERLIDEIMRLSGVDVSKLIKSEREKVVEQAAESTQNAAEASRETAANAPPPTSDNKEIVKALAAARGRSANAGR